MSSAGPEDRSWRYIEVNGTNVTVRWIALFTAIITGVITSVFTGIIGGVGAFFDAISAIVDQANAGVISIIEAVAGQSEVIEAAWRTAGQTVGEAGIASFVVGIGVAAGAWYAFAMGVSLLE
jgi:hypothetical protein